MSATPAPPAPGPRDEAELARAWAAALDQFEEHLASYRRVLTDDGEPTEAPWPPAELAGRPVPRALVPRARELLARASLLESDLQERQNAMRTLALSRPRHPQAHPRPSRRSTLL